jgi:CheY-like chemotaxis protein
MSRILIVEDDALVSRIYSQKLAETGFDVGVSADGLEAIRRLPEFKPDLVVLDLLMPKLGGVDVLKFIRQHPELKNTRVIVFSNSFLSNLLDQVTALGIEAALVKAAITPRQLVDAINAALLNPVHHPRPAQQAKTPAAEATKTEPAPPPAVVPSSATTKGEPTVREEGNADFAARIGREFLERIPGVFEDMRQLCREFLEAAKSPREVDCLRALSRRLGLLTQIIGMAGLQRTAELSSALEALVFELTGKLEAITDSSRQTIAFTIAFLADRFDRQEHSEEQDHVPTNILVIDDDAVSNLAVVQSLSRAKITAVCVTDPAEGLERLKRHPYDAVLMDVAMPGLSGLTLCEQARQLPLHKRTPVIFVTGLSDFNTHAQSILSGGNDLIMKPISPNELCVKVMTHLLRPR